MTTPVFIHTGLYGRLMFRKKAWFRLYLNNGEWKLYGAIQQPLWGLYLSGILRSMAADFNLWMGLGMYWNNLNSSLCRRSAFSIRSRFWKHQVQHEPQRRRLPRPPRAPLISRFTAPYRAIKTRSLPVNYQTTMNKWLFSPPTIFTALIHQTETWTLYLTTKVKT